VRLCFFCFVFSNNWDSAYVHVNGVAAVDAHYLDVFAHHIRLLGATAVDSRQNPLWRQQTGKWFSLRGSPCVGRDCLVIA